MLLRWLLLLTILLIVQLQIQPLLLLRKECKLFGLREIIERIKRSAEQVQEIRTITNDGIDKLLRNPSLKDLKKLYDELFSIGDLNGNIKDSNGMAVHNIFYHVATTNYDLALESYARGNKDWHLIVCICIYSR